MDILKLIQSLQDLMYELVVWALLLPKTLLRAIFRPDLIVAYVNREWKKPPEEQFDDYLPPVVFFIITAVLPITAITVMNSTSSTFTPSVTEEELFFSALIALITLIIYLAWIEWLNKRPLKRSGLKRLFYIQCYLVSSSQLIYSLLLLFSLNLLGLLPVAILGMVILILYESFAFVDELKVGWWQGLWYAALPYLTFFILSALAGLVMILLFHLTPSDFIGV
ncbi:MAG: hypothetical protein HYZ22_11170 [Chloroflexi bacterium]|nr:hypothetical protein [Chloroflexota bacterium]